MAIDLNVLCSGSRGNLTLVQAGGTRLLIDIGAAPGATLAELAARDVDLSALSGVLLTHAHGDHAHLGTLRLLAALGVPLYTTPGTWEVVRARHGAEVADRIVRFVDPGAPFAIDGLQVDACRVRHGGRASAPAGDPVCFRLTDGVDHVGYATDLGHVDAPVRAHLRGVGLLVLESNHDLGMLAATTRPPGVKDWIRGDAGHLRNEQAAEALADWFTGVEGAGVLLAHLSAHANTPELAMARAVSALRGRADVRIAVAAGASLGTPWRLERGVATPAEGALRAHTGAGATPPTRAYLCALCGEACHNRVTCTRRRRDAARSGAIPAASPATSPAPAPRRAYACSRCGQSGHNAATCGRSAAPAPAPATPESRREATRARAERAHPGLPARLGVDTDAAIAVRYGLSRARVQQIRVELAIPTATPPFTLTDEDAARLGTLPDRVLADELGASVYRIAAAREARGIPAYSARKAEDDAIAAHRDHVGRISDRKLAAQLGIRHAAVFRFRQRHGIATRVLSPRHAAFRPIDRDAVRRLFLDGRCDADIAEAVGARVGTISTLRAQLGLRRGEARTRLTTEQRAQIRALYDAIGNVAEVARRSGHPPSTVYAVVRGRGR